MNSIRSKARSFFAIAVLAVTAPVTQAATYTVDFEGTTETKTAYASSDVSLSGVSWNMTEALIGTTTADWKTGARSARLNGKTGSAMTMQANKAGGADTIAFSYRRYGTDPQIAWAVEVSSNGGSTWSQVGANFTATDTVQSFNESVNLAGNVRFRILAKETNTSNKRINIDDITVTDFAGPDILPPAIATLSPANNALAVAADSDLVVAFDEAVAAGTGAVNLYAAGGSLVESFTVTAGNISGTTATFNPTADLALSTTYYVEIDSGAFVDLATPANAFGGISGTSTWTFTTASPDITGPAVTTVAPAHGATGVAVNEVPSVSFDEPIFVGSGDILIKKASDNSTVATLTVTDGNQVLISERDAYLKPPADLPADTTLYVEIPAGAFKDASDNATTFYGGSAVWSFTTAPPDTTGPIMTAVTPAHGATGVPVSQVLTVTFDEPVFAGSGDILIKDFSNNSIVATLTVTDVGQVEVSNSEASLKPPAGLPAGATLYVEIPAGAFKDASGNATAAYVGSGVWSFSTVMVPELTGTYTQPFDSFTGTLPVGWTLVSSGGVASYIGSWTSGLTTGGVYGNVSNPGVLGYQHTGDTGTATVTLTLQNNTGSTLTDLWVSYLGRVERIGNPRLPEWTVSLNGTAVPELAYSTGAGVDQTKTHQITGLPITPGAYVTLTWVSDRGTNTTGSARRIGIADVYVGLSEPTSGFAGWAATNSPDQTPDQDYDGDGLDNGVEYFMGTPGNVFTQVPDIVGNKITWPMSATATGLSYKVLTSTDLAQWNEATTGVTTVGGDLVYEVPGATTQLFIRLEVTVQ